MEDNWEHKKEQNATHSQNLEISTEQYGDCKEICRVLWGVVVLLMCNDSLPHALKIVEMAMIELLFAPKSLILICSYP